MELHERLALARRQAGFETAADAARALGISYPTYAGHENGSSGFKNEAGDQYARKFKVRFEWLMIGRGPMRSEVDAALSDPTIAAFHWVLPKLPEERRQRLLADLVDAARLEGVEEALPAEALAAEKTGG